MSFVVPKQRDSGGSSPDERRPWPRDPRFLVGADGTVYGVRGAPLKTYPTRDGYPAVSVYLSSRRRLYTTVHRMVCETFHGPPPSEAHEVAHKNGVPDDARASNLEWKTESENNQDKLAHGTYGRRLTREEALEIRAQPDVSRKALAEKYGVTPGTISHVRTGYTWRAA